MRLAEQWSELQPTLPSDWATVRLALEPDAAYRERAERMLGPVARERSETGFELEVSHGGDPFALSPALFGRLLTRLDRDGIKGRLKLASTEVSESVGAPRLAREWDRLLERLPPRWSHLYAELEVDSSDFVERGALLLGPANPARFSGGRAFNFPAAKSAGYGVAAQMARRCLARLDEEDITGPLRGLPGVSGDRPVAPQG